MEEEKLFTLIEHKPAVFGTTTGDIQVSVRAKDATDALEKMLKLLTSP